MLVRLAVPAVLIVTALLASGGGYFVSNLATESSAPESGAESDLIAGQTVSSGYLATRDGTLLAYNLVLPGDGSGSYPTLMEYSGYSPGDVVDVPYTAIYVPKGYAILGVNVRGTGCSGGTFDFFEPVQGDDGYDAIEWAATQTWSDGKVAMIGKSYPGITQLFTAATRPPHLVAAAPGHVYGDIYRDVVYPGGIYNYAFAGLWSFIAQPQPGYAAAVQKSASGDATCAQNMAQHTVTNARWNPFIQAQEHPYDDTLIQERSPAYIADEIDVPVYLFQSWQDEQVGPRGLSVVENLRAPYYLTISNGDHGMYRTPQSLARLERFFDHYVKGVDNGFENEPRVVVWWDAGANGARAPAWTREYAAWPVTSVEPYTLYLRAGGVLSPDAPSGDESPDAYVYPGGSTSNGAGYGYSNAQMQSVTNQLRAPAPMRVSYTSAPLANDVVILGPGNFSFWASSTAVDTDFQVTLSEVRPDGKVVYVQHGWLRASHRALDGERSSEFRPFQSHTQSDYLTPGSIVELNVEIFPVGQAFRAGSSIRVEIEAPNVLPELWGFVPVPIPAINRIFHDATHPATLMLPMLPGERADTPLPPCGSLIRQSCV